MSITDQNFNDRNVTEYQAKRIENLKTLYRNLADAIQNYVGDCTGREIALVRLKESSMWATEAISKEQFPYYHD